jgi:hypothetical protein
MPVGVTGERRTIDTLDGVECAFADRQGVGAGSVTADHMSSWPGLDPPVNCSASRPFSMSIIFPVAMSATNVP